MTTPEGSSNRAMLKRILENSLKLTVMLERVEQRQRQQREVNRAQNVSLASQLEKLHDGYCTMQRQVLALTNELLRQHLLRAAEELEADGDDLVMADLAE